MPRNGSVGGTISGIANADAVGAASGSSMLLSGVDDLGMLLKIATGYFLIKAGHEAPNIF